MKPILCLDFDGVVHSYVSGWRGPRVIPDPPVPGAIRFLIQASDSFEIHIFSSRSRFWGGRRAMRKWLTHYARMYGAGIADEMLAGIRWPKHKPMAMVTLDDRAVTFKGKWPAPADLLAFKPWNRS